MHHQNETNEIKCNTSDTLSDHSECDGKYVLLHHYENYVNVLGPGCRFALWTQGCPFQCVGCIAPETQSDQGGMRIPVVELSDKILKYSTLLEGITLSGGEPFSQPSALAALVELVRIKAPHLSLMIFSGHKIEALRARADEATDRLLSQADILVDGMFIARRPSPSPWRGSDNQRVWYLTDRYCPEDELAAERSLELFIRPNGAFMAGVPSREQWAKLRQLPQLSAREAHSDCSPNHKPSRSQTE